MPSTTNKPQTRLVIAAALFLFSILASFLITYLGQQGDQYWLSTRAIAQGVQIAPGDVKLAKATLPRGANGYLGSNSNPIGSITRKAISASTLLNSDSLSLNSDELTTESLAIEVRTSDIPISTQSGDIVSLYQVHDSRNGEEVPAPARIISGVFVREIESKSGNFGGTLTVTISIDREEVPIVLAATSSGRIVVVANGS